MRGGEVDVAGGVAVKAIDWEVCVVLADVVLNSHALFGCGAFVVRVCACR